MHSVQQEMQRQERRMIRQPFINVEQEPMQEVLQHGPENVAQKEAGDSHGEGRRFDQCESRWVRERQPGSWDGRGELLEGANEKRGRDGEPNDRDHEPLSSRKDLDD